MFRYVLFTSNISLSVRELALSKHTETLNRETSDAKDRRMIRNPYKQISKQNWKEAHTQNLKTSTVNRMNISFPHR